MLRAARHAGAFALSAVLAYLKVVSAPSCVRVSVRQAEVSARPDQELTIRVLVNATLFARLEAASQPVISGAF